MMVMTQGEPATTTPGPYGAAALNYWDAGWRGILPLPARKKGVPPPGHTGHNAPDPSYADIHAWTTGHEAHGNIGLRLPRHLIGLDIDDYGNKPGAASLADLELNYGVLPPTWRTTSRDDGVSGIRLYRVPEGLAWPGEAGKGIDIIQHGHRYAVVQPSIHPEGRTYRWITPEGLPTTALPDPDDLPDLPDSWVSALTGGVAHQHTPKATLSRPAVAGWLVALPDSDGIPCRRMQRAVDTTLAGFAHNAHNTARDGSLRCARLATEGHPGLMAALTQIRDAFLREATNPDRHIRGGTVRTTAEAAREWAELVEGAANLIIATPSDLLTCDCAGQITGRIAPNIAAKTAPESSTTVADRVIETHSQEGLGHPRLRHGGTFILDVPDTVPTIWGEGDEVLWARGESLMIAGPPGVGKTTLASQVLKARLGMVSHVLGMPVEPTSSRVLYLAMDRPQQIARGLRRLFKEPDRAHLDQHLVVWEGPPPGDIAKHTDILVALAEMAAADTIIIDSVKDAAVGLSADEVAAGYNRARQAALAVGIEVLELHHTTKRGPGGAKPNTLADVYGSAWLTAGAGSVLMLWGEAGDPIVEATHAKQPAGEIGPWQLFHDHDAGITVIYHPTDLLMVVAASPDGLTARAAACATFSTDTPTPAEVKKAARRLNKMVREGLLTHAEGQRGGEGGGTPERWFLHHDTPRPSLEERSRTRSRTVSPPPADDTTPPIPQPPIVPDQSVPETDPGDPGPSDPVPPLVFKTRGDGSNAHCARCGDPTPPWQLDQDDHCRACKDH